MSEAIVALLRAVNFAAQKHARQRRKGEATEPYVNHVIEVAGMLADATAAGDPILLIAGVLHDTVEDTATTPDEIAAEFGAEVSDLVAEVTDDKSLEKQVRKRLQVENTPGKSARAKMIKLADKTSNLRAIIASPPKDWDSARKREYFEWARQVTDGCRGVNVELEAWFDEAYEAGLETLGQYRP